MFCLKIQSRLLLIKHVSKATIKYVNIFINLSLTIESLRWSLSILVFMLIAFNLSLWQRLSGWMESSVVTANYCLLYCNHSWMTLNGFNKFLPLNCVVGGKEESDNFNRPLNVVRKHINNEVGIEKLLKHEWLVPIHEKLSSFLFLNFEVKFLVVLLGFCLQLDVRTNKCNFQRIRYLIDCWFLQFLDNFLENFHGFFEEKLESINV